MEQEKLTIIDFIKGIFVFAGIVGIAIILFYAVSWLLMYPLAMFLDLNISVPFKAFFASLILVLFAILCGFGKASGEGFGHASGYRALRNLKSYLLKKNEE